MKYTISWLMILAEMITIALPIGIHSLFNKYDFSFRNSIWIVFITIILAFIINHSIMYLIGICWLGIPFIIFGILDKKEIEGR